MASVIGNSNGTGHKNNKKRPRMEEAEKNGVHSENMRNSNSPPTKKRKVHQKPPLDGDKKRPSNRKRRKTKKKKNAAKEMQNWSLRDLQTYLDECGVAYQAEQNHAYYLQLATEAKKTQNSKKNAIPEQQSVNGAPSSSSTTTDNRSDADATVSSSTSTSAMSDSSSPFQQPIAIATDDVNVTPPLPENLSMLPFEAAFRDNDEHEQKYESDDRSQETQQNTAANQACVVAQAATTEEEETQSSMHVRHQNGWIVSYSPSETISFSLVTPQARKSRPLTLQPTPEEDALEQAPPPPPRQHARRLSQQPLELLDINDPFEETAIFSGDDDGGELGLESIYTPPPPPAAAVAPAERSQFSVTSSLSPLYENENDDGYLDSLETDFSATETETMTVERLGPFQVIPTWTTSVTHSVTQMSAKMSSQSFLETVRNVNYVWVLGVAICALSMAMLVPYAIAPFIDAPFCDTNSDSIGGTYAVFHDLIRMEPIMSCMPCPSGAQCVNGTAECVAGMHLDHHRVICIADNDQFAAFAANMSFQASVILSERLGAIECNGASSDLSVSQSADAALGESELLHAIQQRFYPRLSTQDLSAEWQFATHKVLPTRASSQLVYFNQTSNAYHAVHASISTWRCWLRLQTQHVPSGVLPGFCAVILMLMAVLIYSRWRARGEYHADAIETANFVLKWLSEHEAFYFSVEDQMRRYAMAQAQLRVSEMSWRRAVDYIDDSRLVQSVMENIDGEQRRCWKWTAPVGFVPLQ